MSRLQSGTQDASGWPFSAFPGFGSLDTLFHLPLTGDRSMAPEPITSEAGALVESAQAKDSGYPETGMVQSSCGGIRQVDRQGGDSGEPFIQSEASVRGNATYRRVSLRRMPV